MRVDKVTRFTTVSQIGHGNVFLRDNSRSTQDVQLLQQSNGMDEINYVREYEAVHIIIQFNSS